MVKVKSFLRKHLLLTCTIIGAIAGNAILHPFGMIVHAFFHLHPDEGYLHLHWEEIMTEFVKAFTLEHLPGSISYIVLSGIIGFLFGKQILNYNRQQDILQKLALIDELTGIYNRRGFITFSEQLIKLSNRTKRGLILGFIDLNNLKDINDKSGHSEGDKTLLCIAEVLKKTFRGSDIIGRIGGDEFVVLALEAG